MGFYYDSEEALRRAERYARMGVDPNLAVRLGAMGAMHWSERPTSKPQNRTASSEAEEEIPPPGNFPLMSSRYLIKPRTNFL